MRFLNQFPQKQVGIVSYVLYDRKAFEFVPKMNEIADKVRTRHDFIDLINEINEIEKQPVSSIINIIYYDDDLTK